jgi:inhibitor of KinA
MASLAFTYRIFPLGDTAFTVDFSRKDSLGGNIINENINNEVIARFNELKRYPLPGMIEALPAYSSLTVYYDIMALRKKIPSDKTVYEWISKEMENRLQQPSRQDEKEERVIKIPVCYEREFAPDIHHLAKTKNISVEEVIQIHTATAYKVYMLGFMPGFPYMGEVDEKITMPRKSQPVNVAAGSVGIAGKQTGIYPFASPGGWQVIGRTPAPLTSLNPSEGGALDPESITLLKAGDKVQFYSIMKQEFESIAKQ